MCLLAQWCWLLTGADASGWYIYRFSLCAFSRDCWNAHIAFNMLNENGKLNNASTEHTSLLASRPGSHTLLFIYLFISMLKRSLCTWSQKTMVEMRPSAYGRCRRCRQRARADSLDDNSNVYFSFMTHKDHANNHDNKNRRFVYCGFVCVPNCGYAWKCVISSLRLSHTRNEILWNSVKLTNAAVAVCLCMLRWLTCH